MCKKDKQLAEHVTTYMSWHEMKPLTIKYDSPLAILIGTTMDPRIVYVVKERSGFWATERSDMLPPKLKRKALLMRESS